MTTTTTTAVTMRGVDTRTHTHTHIQGERTRYTSMMISNTPTLNTCMYSSEGGCVDMWCERVHNIGGASGAGGSIKCLLRVYYYYGIKQSCVCV